MFAKLPFAHSEKKRAKTCEESETRAEKARTEVSRHENERSSPDEQRGASFHSKLFGMEPTAADIRLAARLESVSEKREEQEGGAKQTAEDASGRTGIISSIDPTARNTYPVPTVAFTPATTELRDKRKVANMFVWTDDKLGTPGPGTFDDSEITIGRAPDHGESIRCTFCAHEGLSNRDQFLMPQYTARVPNHAGAAHPHGDGCGARATGVFFPNLIR